MLDAAHGIRASQFLSVEAAGLSKNLKICPSGFEGLISYLSIFLNTNLHCTPVQLCEIGAWSLGQGSNRLAQTNKFHPP